MSDIEQYVEQYWPISLTILITVSNSFMNNFFGLYCIQYQAILTNFVYNSENNITKYFVQYYVHYCKQYCNQFWTIVINIGQFDKTILNTISTYTAYNFWKQYCMQRWTILTYKMHNFREIEGVILYINMVQNIGQYCFPFWAIFKPCRCSKYVKVAHVVRNCQHLSIYLNIARNRSWNCDGPICRWEAQCSLGARVELRKPAPAQLSLLQASFFFSHKLACWPGCLPVCKVWSTQSKPGINKTRSGENRSVRLPQVQYPRFSILPIIWLSGLFSMFPRASRTMMDNSLHLSSTLYASWLLEFMRPQNCSLDRKFKFH